MLDPEVYRAKLSSIVTDRSLPKASLYMPWSISKELRAVLNVIEAASLASAASEFLGNYDTNNLNHRQLLTFKAAKILISDKK